MRGRNSKRSGRDRKTESDEEFDFGTTEEVDDGYKGSNQRDEPELETTERGAGISKKGRKAGTRTRFDVVKGLKKGDELEIANSDKSGNRSQNRSLEGQADERAMEEVPTL